MESPQKVGRSNFNPIHAKQLSTMANSGISGELKMFELVDNLPQNAVIKVVGVGGGGGKQSNA